MLRTSWLLFSFCLLNRKMSFDLGDMDSWHSPKEAGNFLMTTRRNPEMFNELENLFNSVSRGKESKQITTETKKFSFSMMLQKCKQFLLSAYCSFPHVLAWQENGGNRELNKSDFSFYHHQQLLVSTVFFFLIHEKLIFLWQKMRLGESFASSHYFSNH